MKSEKRVFLVLLDGANREALLHGINNGDLPNISEYASGGSVSTLKTPLPPTTPVSAATLLTGKKPDSHGIFGFEKDGSYVGYDGIEAPTVFDILEEEGKTAVSVNVPMTNPPPEIEGYVVSGFPVKSREIAWPPPLGSKLRAMNYRVEPSEFEETGDFVEDIHQLAEQRFQAAFELVDRDWDLFMLAFTGDARLQHYVDDSEVLARYYRKVDRYIGQLLDAVGGEPRFILISTHGFQDLEVEFDIGRWLRERGYIDIEEDVDWSKLYGETVTEDSGTEVVPEGAYMTNLSVREGLEEKLQEELSSLEYDGRKVFRDVFRSGELYGDSEGPDLIPVPRRGFSHVMGKEEMFVEDPEESRVPDSESVIVTDFELEDSRPETVDVLPTLLEFLGLERGDLDGQKLQRSSRN